MTASAGRISVVPLVMLAALLVASTCPSVEAVDVLVGKFKCTGSVPVENVVPVIVKVVLDGIVVVLVDGAPVVEAASILVALAGVLPVVETFSRLGLMVNPLIPDITGMVLVSETRFGKESLVVYCVVGITSAEGLDVVSLIVETTVGDEAPLTVYIIGAILLTGEVEAMIIIGAVGGTGGPTKEMLVVIGGVTVDVRVTADLFDIESVVLVPEESATSDIIGAVLVAIDEEPNIFDGTGVLPTTSDIFRFTVDIKPVVLFIVAATVVLPRVIDI